KWFEGTIQLQRLVQSQLCGKSGAYPKRIGRFDKHSAGADVASVRAHHRGTPFDFEVGVKAIARRPAALESADSLIPTAHRPGESPCPGSQGAAHGRSRRLFSYTTRPFLALLYDAVSSCFVPCIAQNATRKYYSREQALTVCWLVRVVWFSFSQAALDFRLQIATEIFGNDSGRSQFLQIGNSKFRQIG